MNEVDKIYENFWRDILENLDGTLNLEQLKKELFDYYNVMHNTAKVYDHITGGKISKINTDPDTVINVAEDYYTSVSQNGYFE